MKQATAKLQAVMAGATEETMAAFVTDPASREIIFKAATARSWSEQSVRDGDIASAIQYMTEIAAPSIVIVEFADSERATLDVSALSQCCGPETAIIGIGTINDVELYRDLIQSGLTDYLVKPVDEDALDRVLDHAFRSVSGDPDEAKKGKLITVIGARGGVGASTVVLNCAWLMAHEQNLHTAILDLDLYFGTSALALDLLPGRGLRESLENPGRIDSLFVASAMVSASDRLFILAGEEPLEEEFVFDPGALNQLVDELRQNFTRIVVDLPRNMTLSHRQVLAISSEIVIVADLSLASVRDTTRLRTLVHDLAPQARIMVVANQVAGKKRDVITRSDFEGGIEGKIDHIIPYDLKAAGGALNSGKSVVQQAKGSPLATALRGLAVDVTGIQPKKPRGFFRRRRSKRS